MSNVEQHVLAFIEKIDHVGGLEEAIASFDKLISFFGYDYFRCAEIVRRNDRLNPYVAFGEINQDWCNHYKDSRYVYNDSTIQLGLNTKYPFSWNDVKEKKRISSAAKKIFEEAESDFGYKDGLVVPIHLSDGSISMFSLVGEVPDTSDVVRRGLGMAAVYLHAKVRSKLLEDSDLISTKHPNVVSRRQLDCIQWVAEGKTDWEIGQILGISESTVHNHIENAKKNLAVNTRIQAVVEASRRRLIIL